MASWVMTFHFCCCQDSLEMPHSDAFLPGILPPSSLLPPPLRNVEQDALAPGSTSRNRPERHEAIGILGNAISLSLLLLLPLSDPAPSTLRL